MRQVRDLARARFDLVEDRTRVKQRIEKLLEDALIKISSVLTDVLGVSGRAMIEALIAGQRNPKVLAELAKGRARRNAGRPGTGPARPVHRPPRPAGPAAAGPTRRADRAHRRGHRAARRRDQRPAHPHPGHPDRDHRRRRRDQRGIIDGSTGTRPGTTRRGRPAVRRPRRRPGLGPRGPGRDRPGHERVRHRRAAVLLGQGRPAHRAVRPQERPGPHRQGQPLPQIRARPDRHRRREDRHLPRRTLPTVDQTHAQGQGPGRAATLHPGHLLPPARRPHRRVHRPRIRLLRQAASTAPAAPPTCCANCTPWATRSSSPRPPPNPHHPTGHQRWPGQPVPDAAITHRPRRWSRSPVPGLAFRSELPVRLSPQAAQASPGTVWDCNAVLLRRRAWCSRWQVACARRVVFSPGGPDLP